MQPLTFVSQTFSRTLDCFRTRHTSLSNSLSKIGNTRIAIGSFTQFQLGNIRLKAKKRNFSQLLADSETLCPVQDKVLIRDQRCGRNIVNLTEEKNLCIQRLFSYHMVSFLSGRKYTHTEYIQFIDRQPKDSQSPREHIRSFWNSFRDSSLWKRLTLFEKVKALALYHLFGEVTRLFLEDLSNNIMTFLVSSYSSKEEVSSLFSNSLEILNRFLAKFASTTEEFAKANPQNSNFEVHLQAEFTEGKFIQAALGVSENLSPNELFISLNELFLQYFLPKLKVQEATFNKLVWNSGILAISLSYIAAVILFIPAFILEKALNYSIRNALRGNCSIFNPFQLVLSPISELIQNKISKQWDPKLKTSILAFLQGQIEKLKKSNATPTSSTHLNPTIRKKLSEFVRSLILAIDLNNKNGQRNEIKKALDPQSKTQVDERYRLSLEKSCEEALLSLFAFLTTDDLVENTLHTLFSMLTDLYTENPSSNQNNSPEEIPTEDMLFNQIEQEVIKPLIERGIEKAVGNDVSAGIHEIERFFTSYKAQFLPQIEKICEIITSDNARLEDARNALGRHRDEMRSEFQVFKQLFQDIHPKDVEQVENKLAIILEKQNEAFTAFLQAFKHQSDLDIAFKHQKLIEEIYLFFFFEKFLQDYQEPNPDPNASVQEVKQKLVQSLLEFFRNELESSTQDTLSAILKDRSLKKAFEDFLDEHFTTSSFLSRLMSKLNRKTLPNISIMITYTLISASQSTLRRLQNRQEIPPQDELNIFYRSTQNKYEERLKCLLKLQEKQQHSNSDESGISQQKQALNNLDIPHFNPSRLVDQQITDTTKSLQSSIDTILSHLEHMKNLTTNLSVDSVVTLKPTQLVSAGIGGILGFTLFPAIPFSVPVFSIASAKTDVANIGVKIASSKVIFPRIKQTFKSGWDFFFDNKVYQLVKQMGAVIAKKELEKKR